MGPCNPIWQTQMEWLAPGSDLAQLWPLQIFGEWTGIRETVCISLSTYHCTLQINKCISKSKWWSIVLFHTYTGLMLRVIIYTHNTHIQHISIHMHKGKTSLLGNSEMTMRCQVFHIFCFICNLLSKQLDDRCMACADHLFVDWANGTMDAWIEYALLVSTAIWFPERCNCTWYLGFFASPSHMPQHQHRTSTLWLLCLFPHLCLSCQTRNSTMVGAVSLLLEL